MNSAPKTITVQALLDQGEEPAPLLAANHALLGGLLGLYQAPGRFHHNLEHAVETWQLCRLLPEYLGVVLTAEERNALDLAALLHDTASGANHEEASAAMAYQCLLHSPYRSIAGLVARLIINGTKHGSAQEQRYFIAQLFPTISPAREDVLASILSCADLATLAADPMRYATYAREILLETMVLDRNFSTEGYVGKRLSVLQDFTIKAKDSMLFPFREIYAFNYQASHNMEWEMLTSVSVLLKP